MGKKKNFSGDLNTGEVPFYGWHQAAFNWGVAIFKRTSKAATATMAAGHPCKLPHWGNLLEMWAQTSVKDLYKTNRKIKIYQAN